MTYDNDNLNPLYIENGTDLLTPKTKEGDRYTFEHVSITNIPILDYPAGVEPDDMKDEDVQILMQNVDSAICFQRIGDLFRKKIDSKNELDFSEKNYSKTPFFSNPEEIKQKYCAFVTPNGTIAPQILYCEDFGDNDIGLSTDKDITTKRETANNNKSYYWVAQVPQLSGNESEETQKALNQEFHFGIRHDVSKARKNGYISILGRHPLIDTEDNFNRTYVSNFPSTKVFAILLDIPYFENDPDGNNPPQVSFQFLNDDTLNLSSEASSPDTVSISVVPNGNVTVHVGENSFSDSLVFSQLGTKITHTNSNALSSKNVIFVYSLMNSLVVTGDLNTTPNNSNLTKCIVVKKNKDFDIIKNTEPPLNEYPSEHKQGRAGEIEIKNKKLFINFGNTVQSTWVNCIGSFAIAALRYCPIVKFSYFYKVGGDQTNTETNGLNKPEDYFYLETCKNNGNFSGLSGKQNAKKVIYDKNTQTTIFRVDFNIYVNNENSLQTIPFEIFGLVHITKRSGKLTEVLNEDGNFSTGFEENFDQKKYNKFKSSNAIEATSNNNPVDWTRFITSVNVSHGLDGTSGSISVDKFMLMKNLSDKPKQVIGALTLVAKNGFYTKTEATKNNGFKDSKIYETLPWGQFFRGYGMEISDDVSENNSQLTIKLVGIQKKLSDMKLVNCPFWDGDRVFPTSTSDLDAVLNYMISYSGCDLVYEQQLSEGLPENIILPRSYDWQSPSTNFVLGTSVLEAIKDIAKKVNHQFVIQPDGRGYFYVMDDYGCPKYIKESNPVMTYKESEIISINISPYMENRYNTFLTLGLLVKNTPGSSQIVPDGGKPGMQFTVVNNGEGDYPWSRIITNREPGLVTLDDLEKFHKINVKFGSSKIFQGTIVVPGFHAFYIFDKIQITCENGENLLFYITGINHNINLQTKEWLTSLSVATFEVKDSNNNNGGLK